jgi:hypothetical protein
MGSGAKHASNIYTMTQISNMHYYLLLEEFGEARDLKAAETEEMESSSNVGSFVS